MPVQIENWPAQDVVPSVLTVIGLILVAVGWYAAATANYRRSRQLEETRDARERRGVERQARTLLRMAIKNIEPFFYDFKSLQLEDATVTWTWIRDFIRDRMAATALSDELYDALENFWSEFGQDIAIAQSETRRWQGEVRAASDQDIRDRRNFLAQCFRAALPALGTAVEALGDARLREEFKRVEGRSDAYFENVARREEAIYRRTMLDLGMLQENGETGESEP